jgi:murein DD-endopeptidase MepM/ murein hydrolase activator NlpD
MRRIESRAGWRRALAYLLALALWVGPAVGGALAQDTAPAGGTMIASAGEAVLLREQPGYDAAVLAPLGDGSPLDVAGGVVMDAAGLAWLPVVAGGQSGFVPAGYVADAAAAPATLTEAAAVAPNPMPDPALTAPAAAMGGAATTADANLRAGPSAEAAVILVLPQGTAVSIDGEPTNGFVPVTGNGVSGWLAAELLSGGTAPLAAAQAPDATVPVAENPALPDPIVAETVAAPPAETVAAPEAARGESTGIVWPMAGGEWEVVQGYNNGTHTNRGGFAQYKYSLDWARVNGDTAGQPVYAPVSGTIEWVDRGSGGMLIDAGNGYGVAVFHVTREGSLGRGDSVERGQRIGTISGPGGDGYMSMAHIEIAVWRLTGNGHESVPFVGPNAIAGQEFPDDGGTNQHMGARVSP